MLDCSLEISWNSNINPMETYTKRALMCGSVTLFSPNNILSCWVDCAETWSIFSLASSVEPTELRKCLPRTNYAGFQVNAKCAVYWSPVLFNEKWERLGAHAYFTRCLKEDLSRSKEGVIATFVWDFCLLRECFYDGILFYIYTAALSVMQYFVGSRLLNS